MKVRIDYNIHSTAPGVTGLWTLSTTREFPAVPRAGDYVELAEDWSSVEVKNTAFMSDGSVLINVRPEITDDPNSIASCHRLADEFDWEWLGYPPPKQPV